MPTDEEREELLRRLEHMTEEELAVWADQQLEADSPELSLPAGWPTSTVGRFSASWRASTATHARHHTTGN